MPSARGPARRDHDDVVTRPTSRNAVNPRVSVIALALLLALAGCGPESSKTVPDDLIGVWKTSAPKYADKDVINPTSVVLSGCMMFRFMGWKEVADIIEDAIARTIQQKKVTYDLERLMPGATKLKTSEFASAIIENLQAVAVAV